MRDAVEQVLLVADTELVCTYVGAAVEDMQGKIFKSSESSSLAKV